MKYEGNGVCVNKPPDDTDHTEQSNLNSRPIYQENVPLD